MKVLGNRKSTILIMTVTVILLIVFHSYSPVNSDMIDFFLFFIPNTFFNQIECAERCYCDQPRTSSSIILNTKVTRETVDRLCSEAFTRRLQNKSMVNTDGVVETIKVPAYSYCHRGQRFKIMIGLYIHNQANMINEFLAVHYAVGVSLFVIYDDRSTDNIRKVLSPWIKAGIVKLVLGDEIGKPFGSRLSGGQWRFYNFAYREFAMKKGFDWVSFIDTDEWIIPLKNRCLSDFLKEYTEFATVAIPETTFETFENVDFSEDARRMIILELTNYKMGRWSALIKSMCNVKKIAGPAFDIPHCCTPIPPYYEVDELKNKIVGDCWTVKDINSSSKIVKAHFRHLTINQGIQKLERDFEWNGAYGVSQNNFMKLCEQKTTKRLSSSVFPNSAYLQQTLIPFMKCMLNRC